MLLISVFVLAGATNIVVQRLATHRGVEPWPRG
jgi:hypothetical protein